jgi:hypothetical protein
VKAIEEKLGVSIRSLRLAQLLEEDGKPAAKIKGIQETVSVNSSLLKVKVLDTVLQGADYGDANQWRDFVNIVDMNGVEKVEWPTISPDDFAVREGYHDGTGRLVSGGQYGTVSLNVSNEKTIRYMHLRIREQDVKFKKWGAIEEALKSAGYAFSLFMLKTVVKAIQTDAGVSQAFSTDLYNTILQLLKQGQQKGFRYNRLIVGPTPNATLMNIANFIDAQKLDREGVNVAKGQVGQLFVPVHLVQWSGVDTDITNVLAIVKEKAQVMGLAQDMEIKEVDETVLRGLHHAVITMQFDLVKGFANANGKAALS